MTLPDPNLPWAIPPAAVRLIAQFEGCRLVAYRCPAGIWTIGYGDTENVKAGQRITQEEADERLAGDVAAYAAKVGALLVEPASPNELGALVSLAYNIGVGALAKSTVLRAHNAGDRAAAARAFALWNKARVRGALTELDGLISRRAAEAALYLTPEPEAPRERMPQAVADESSLRSSPMMKSGATTVGVGAVLAAPDLATAVQTQLPAAKAAVDAVQGIATSVLGPHPGWVLPVILVVAGVAVMVWRRRQRLGGWA